MTFSRKQKVSEGQNASAVKTARFGFIFASAAVAGTIGFIGFPVLTPESDTVSSVEMKPECPVMYIYPSDGSKRKVIVPEQSNCTEENAGKVMSVNFSDSGKPIVTEYRR